MSRSAVERSAAQASRVIGIHGISGAATGETDFDAVMRAAQGRIPHSTARQSTAGRLRAVGLDVVPTGNHPHVTIVMPAPITDGTLSALEGAFDAPQANPYPRTQP
jgi:hypothetical protein